VSACKQALEEAGGEAEKALAVLQRESAKSAEKKADRVLGSGAIEAYVHNNKKVGVILEIKSESDFVSGNEEFRILAKDIAMHIAAARPRWIRRDDVPEETLEEERRFAAAQARNEGKPDKVIDKIVDGRVEKFYQDTVLYDQTFVNTDKFQGTVGEMVQAMAAQMGENIMVSQMARIGVGEAE